MKKILSLFVVILLFISIVGCNDETTVTVLREDQFIVGLEANYAPFNWTEDQSTVYNYPINNFQGKYADGYDVQIAKAIAASLGKVLVIEKLEWDALIPALESNKIDSIIAGMSPTEERKQSVSFSDGYYQSTHVVLVKSDSDYADATSVNDFEGATIVAQHGTIYNDLVEQLVGANQATPLKSIPDILTQILGNKADGTILELPVATGVIASNSEFTYVTLDPGFVVAEEDVIVSVAVRLDETDLIDNINSILESIVDDTRIRLMEQAVNRSND